MSWEGAGALGEFFSAALHPRLDAEFLTLTGISAVTTLGYAVLGTALAVLIGLVGGVLSCQVWWRARTARPKTAGAGWALVRVLLAVPRGIHEVVWGLLLLIVFGLDPVVAVLAIGIPFGAVTAKVFAEIFDETARKPFLALIGSGSGRGAALLYGLLPAALPDLVSYSFYRFECAIRSAAVLGMVGAGGLGFQLALSFQSLRYEEIWTLLYALIVLCVAVDRWSARVRAGWAAGPRPGRRRAWWLTYSVVLAVLLVPLSAWWVGLNLSVLWHGSVWDLAGELLGELWPPELAGGAGRLASLAGLTVAMSVLAMLIAFWGGALLAFPAARLPSGGRLTGGGRLAWLRVFTVRLVLLVLRAIPAPVWALLFLFVLSPGVLAGALALGAYTMGVLGRLMAEAAENLDGGPLRALRAQGASEPRVFCYAVVPAAAPRFVAFGLYRWEVTIRETVVVGAVGAGGLGLRMDQQLAAFDYRGLMATLLVIFAMTVAVDFLSAAIRRHVRTN